ncbi:MAG: hypothetical protein IJ418_05110 [Clostridia bacterium]|nr:hypothetical protein [Clostridia bacterium]
MLNASVLRSAARLLAYIYNDIMLCPLSEEHDLLLNAGNQSAEDLFDACRCIFGSNMNTAFQKACVFMSNYCDSLLEHADDLFQESNADIIIADTDTNIAAVEYLAEHAPIDSIAEKAILDSLAYHSRLCYNQLLKRYPVYDRSYRRKTL